MTTDEIEKIQEYIRKKIHAIRYEYTTLSHQEKREILIDLIANWIDYEMMIRGEKNERRTDKRTD